MFLLLGKSLYVDRLFKRFQKKDSNAKRVRIRLIDPHVNTDSVIKDLAEQLEPLRERDPVLLHIDAVGVSMQPFVSAGRRLRCWLGWSVLHVTEWFFSRSSRFVQDWRSSCSVCSFWAV